MRSAAHLVAPPAIAAEDMTVSGAMVRRRSRPVVDQHRVRGPVSKGFVEGRWTKDAVLHV